MNHQVESSRTVELTPIENSIEAIEKRNQQLALELAQRNAKTLQAVLQGSVLLRIFLSPYHSFLFTVFSVVY